MLLRLRLPKTLLWVVNLFLFYLLLFTFFRILTLGFFKPDDLRLVDLLPSFWLGLRFDLRWISILLLPVVIAGSISTFSPYYSEKAKNFWSGYLAITTFLVTLIYTIDFGCFAYYRVRLGSTVLTFLDDAGIATVMLWESYPLFWMLLGLLLFVWLLRRLFQYLHATVNKAVDERRMANQRKWIISSFFLLLFLVYGNFPQPLEWKSAFKANDDFGGYLALNPLQTVYSTLGNRQPVFDEQQARRNLPVIGDWQGWGQGNPLKRQIPAATGFFSQKPNVVLVICESFSMYKTSMSGNPLNATPYFNKLAENGLFFENCFTPHFATARGMFATITGIPDVQLAQFSNRTEAAKNQHSIINNFEDYSKYYFLGGSPAFNNFEGLMRNVDGIKMKTEGSFKSKPLDVWGISDKDLFLEAAEMLSSESKPFFAIIQTADNHPPYSVSEADKDFEKLTIPAAQLKRYGFESAEQFNAMRYFDYSVRKFMDYAKTTKWYDNTLFVFVGDHGVAGNAYNIYPAIWTDNRLTEMHVPLLFYAPGKLRAEKKRESVSQIDVLPTIAGIAGESYTNTTLGRDLLEPNTNPSAFFIRHDEGEIGLITNDFYFTKNILFEKEQLLSINNSQLFSSTQLDSVKKKLSSVATAYLETARFMLLNNKKN